MAEGTDPEDRDRHKNESILRWLEDVQMASEDVPGIHDRGLISNPAQTSYFAPDPIGVDAVTTADPHQAPLPHTTPPHPAPAAAASSLYFMHHPQASSHHQSYYRKVQAPSKRSQSFSLLSRPLLTASLSRRQSAQSHNQKKVSPIHKPSPLAQGVVSGSHSVDIHESKETRDLPEPEKKIEKVPKEEKKEAKTISVDETLSPLDKGVGSHLESEEIVDRPESKKDREQKPKEEKREEVTEHEHEQRLQEIRSLTKTRQSSLSPLPLPTVQSSLPTFNLSDIGCLPTKRNRLPLIKKLPTVTGMQAVRKVSPNPAVKLLRASTSPSELSITKAKSAPSSPRPQRVEGDQSPTVSTGVLEKTKEREEKFALPNVLERRKSFSHDDVTHLQQLTELNVGGVSPIASYESSDGDVPSTQHSLCAEEGSSHDGGKMSDESTDKLGQFPSDGLINVKDNPEGEPCHQSESPVDADPKDSDSADQAFYYGSEPCDQFNEHQEDQSKVLAAAVCPISPPTTLPSHRTPHSSLVRQRHISRSPSPPSHTHRRSISPFHKSRQSGSSSGNDSENMISKQKLKKLEEGQTFSFDTSEDTVFTKVSKQPKFLLKKSLQSMPICPLSPPSLPSPSSPHTHSHRHSSTDTLSQCLSHHHHHHHHTPSDNTSSLSTFPTQLHVSSGAPSQQTGHSVPNKTSRSRSPVLSEQLFQRRGSTPATLSSTRTSRASQISPFLAKSSNSPTTTTTTTRASGYSTIPSVTTASLAPLTVLSAKSAAGESKGQCPASGQRGDSLKCTNPGGSEGAQAGVDASDAQSGALDKGPVNRQDSGIGTLSTTSNKCDFRM